MRFFLTFLSIVLLGSVAGPFLPWWSLAAVAVLSGLWSGLRPLGAFAAGFMAGLLLWGGYAGWIDALNTGILSERMGELFGGLGSTQLVLITALAGGLTAALGALTGALGRNAMG